MWWTVQGYAKILLVNAENTKNKNIWNQNTKAKFQNFGFQRACESLFRKCKTMSRPSNWFINRCHWRSLRLNSTAQFTPTLLKNCLCLLNSLLFLDLFSVFLYVSNYSRNSQKKTNLLGVSSLGLLFKLLFKIDLKKG